MVSLIGGGALRHISLATFCTERIHNTKERIYFMKERKTKRQKRELSNHSHERIFQVMTPSFHHIHVVILYNYCLH